MEALVSFMNTGIGRAVRIVLGLALVYVGLAIAGGALGVDIAVLPVPEPWPEDEAHLRRHPTGAVARGAPRRANRDSPCDQPHAP